MNKQNMAVGGDGKQRPPAQEAPVAPKKKK